jgi:glycosyltransferase involved in cell wall biosynthesis
VLRFFHPRLTKTIAALRRADADVYLCQGSGMNAGLTADVAHAMGRAFAFLVGHDNDVMPALPDVHGWRDRTWCRRALRGADTIVAQTEKQRGMLRAGFGLDSVVIMNPVELPARTATPATSRRVVWLATYKDSKRPDWFTRLAERHPEIECVMAGVVLAPPADGPYAAALAVARRCPNLQVLGTIPHERIGELLESAALFTHTSPAEGFPNTFLEAWSHGLPTVTCFDPDGIIARERLGEQHDDFAAWEASVLRWLADPQLRAAAGARARDYAAHAHGSGEIHDRFAAVLDRLIAARRGAEPRRDPGAA